MGFLDRMLGKDEPDAQRAPEPRRDAASPSADEQAIARYRYLLRTAPADAIEQAHAEAFAQLNPAQRQQVLQDLARELPASERAQSADPQGLARMATRAELRQPGFLERTLGPGVGGGYGGGGMGMGGVIGGSLLGSLAGSFIGTAIAERFMGGFEHSAERFAYDPVADAAGRDADGQDADAQHADSQDADAQDADAQDEQQSDSQEDVASEDEYANDDDFGGGDDFGGSDDFDV